VARVGLVLLSTALCLVACGSAKPRTASTRTARCTSATALAGVEADIAAVRRAAALPTKNTLLGNAAINRATDTFLHDVALAHITNLQRNRLIDHAAGALAGSCEQCFQALEAARPIPSLRAGARC
jgi:hypothetical protein